MYFAKMVHSQTRRCIQNSVTPLPQMMPTTSTQYMATTNIKPTVDPVTMDGYQYVNNVDSTAVPFMANNYQRYVSMPNNEQEQLLNRQVDNMPLEMPTLTNFPRSERNNGMNFRQLSVAPSMPTQQLYQYQPKLETNNNNEVLPINGNYNKQEILVNSISSTPTNTSMTLSSVTNLLPKDKQFTEFKESSNLSTPISSTFGEVPNVTMIPQNDPGLKEIPKNTTTITKTNIETNIKPAVTENIQQRQIQMPIMNKIPLTSTNQNDKVLSQPSQNVNPNEDTAGSQLKKIENPVINEIKSEDLPSKLQDKPITSLGIEPTKSVIKTSTTYSNNSNSVNTEDKTNEQIKPTNASTILPNTESYTSSTPVSIENIENAIYGELLSPLETEDIQKPETSVVAPTLLENLVTQPENIESENLPQAETIVNEENPENITPVNNNNVTVQESEQILDTQNYEQTTNYDEYNNSQQISNETTNNVNDYNNYENPEGTTIDETQQQQQYDYSNYDPSQYSYPGYIYDETTGEYKPDPNAPADQYATDQQYTTEGYDQQYQQQDVYDYNQTYNQDPTNSTENVENLGYNNYDTTSQEDSSSNNVQDVVQQPEVIAEPEIPQPEITSEDTVQPAPKITKPTSILSTADKNDSHKKKKRVNFVDSSETDESVPAEKAAASSTKTPAAENVAASGESDFDFSSSTEPEVKTT